MGSGVDSMVVAPGKGRQRKGHFNPFVEFEDREVRLQMVRGWLKDDTYMHETMKGMRLNSVQARLNIRGMSGDELYEDAVYFGPYSCGLRTHQQKKADRRSVIP